MIAKYRVAWTFKPGLQNPPDPISLPVMEEKLKETLRVSYGNIDDEYHIDLNSVNVSRKCTFSGFL